jgi:transcription antitermination protein NusB
MISRRNIRIKVMQTLYSLGTGESAEPEIKQASRSLEDKLEQSLDIFTFSVLFTLHVARYAETDAQLRANRYLKSNDDNADVARLLANSLVVRLTADKAFNERVAKNKIDRYLNPEWVKKVYHEMLNTDEYKRYMAVERTDRNADAALLQHVWEKLVLESDTIQSYFADELPGWEDDSDLIVMLMQNFFRAQGKVSFTDLLDKAKREYAHELLRTVIDKKDMCLEMITGKLNNWDRERVALIDVLLIRMGICEFLFFPTIPTKVTINEYIDIAKQYSTPQSGQFVNGVLDNILKDLLKDNRIHKDEKGRN